MGVRLLRSVEIALGVVGAACLGVSAGAALDGFANSRAAVADFTAKLPTPSAVGATTASVAHSSPPARAPDADFSLWSARRIAAFEKAWRTHDDLPVAVLQIPKIQLEVPVFGDSSALSLNRGVGWIAGTALPGHEGNVGIAGHRDGFFRGLRLLSRGDDIVLLTRGSTETFRVDRIELVRPEDISVLQQSAGHTLTLVTCYPFFYIGPAPRRFVVRARLEGQVQLFTPSEQGRKIPFNLIDTNFQGGKSR